MASLTPGVLSKLLNHLDNKHIKVTGEHRSPLLQVIEIIPSNSDPFKKNRGFFLKVSDSLHCTYVSISKEDADLIFSDKIQLGQFVHVDRIDSGTPLPVLRGVKPVAKRRACVGNPTDLFTESESLLPFRLDMDFGGVRKELKLNKSRRASIGIGNGNVKVEEMEVRRLSLDTMRRGWEKSDSPRLSVGGRSRDTKTSSDSASVPSGKVFLRNDSPSRHQLSNNSPLKSKRNFVPVRVVSEPSKGDIKPPKECISRKDLVEVPIQVNSFDDHIKSCDSLPSNILDLGKTTLLRRDAALLATVDALQEASAAESIVRCMSMFAELSGSAQRDSPGCLIEQFLDLYQSMQLAGSVVDALFKTRNLQVNTGTVTISQIPSLEICKSFSDRNADATLWAQAAMKTDLARFSLFSGQDKKGNQHGPHNYVVLEASSERADLQVKDQIAQITKSLKSSSALLDLSAKKGQSPKRRVGVSPKKNTKEEKVQWTKGQGLEAVASLAQELLSVSREWFLKYLEDSLQDGFMSRLEKGGNDIAILLGQLKRVNQWLENAVSNELQIDERVECLRKKLYSFLLEHVDNSIGACM